MPLKIINNMGFAFIEEIGGLVCWLFKGCKTKYTEERSLYYSTRNLIVGSIFSFAVLMLVIGILIIKEKHGK